MHAPCSLCVHAGDLVFLFFWTRRSSVRLVVRACAVGIIPLHATVHSSISRSRFVWCTPVAVVGGVRRVNLTYVSLRPAPSRDIAQRQYGYWPVACSSSKSVCVCVCVCVCVYVCMCVWLSTIIDLTFNVVCVCYTGTCRTRTTRCRSRPSSTCPQQRMCSARQSHILTSVTHHAPLFQNGLQAKSGFESVF